MRVCVCVYIFVWLCYVCARLSVCECYLYDNVPCNATANTVQTVLQASLLHLLNKVLLQCAANDCAGSSHESGGKLLAVNT